MTARLLLDEMYPPALAEQLREHGHDVLAVAALPDLVGSADDQVLEAATGAGRCLVTENVRDFAVLTRRTAHSGVLFVAGVRWPRSPGGIKRLAEAISALIACGQLPGPGGTGWLS